MRQGVDFFDSLDDTARKRNMANLGLVLLVFGFVCFFLGSIKIGDPYRMKLIAAGLAFVTGAEIFGGLSNIFHWR